MYVHALNNNVMLKNNFLKLSFTGSTTTYRIAGKVGGKKIWRIVPKLAIGEYYFGDCLQGHYNYIHNL